MIDTTGNPFAAGHFVGGADNYLGVSFQDTNIFGGGQVFGFAQIDAVSILRVLYDDMGMDLDLQAALNPGPSPGVGPAPMPEPNVLLLLGVRLVGAVYMRRRKVNRVPGPGPSTGLGRGFLTCSCCNGRPRGVARFV